MQNLKPSDTKSKQNAAYIRVFLNVSNTKYQKRTIHSSFLQNLEPKIFKMHNTFVISETFEEKVLKTHRRSGSFQKMTEKSIENAAYIRNFGPRPTKKPMGF